MRLPVGFIYEAARTVTLDPDTGVREAISHLFATFEATGSARAVVKAFAAEGLAFPGRHDCVPHAGGLYWKPLGHDHVLFVLHNPRYAGAYFYGRRSLGLARTTHSAHPTMVPVVCTAITSSTPSSTTSSNSNPDALNHIAALPSPTGASRLSDLRQSRDSVRPPPQWWMLTRRSSQLG
ncbi:MAG: recombinase family protein [Acidimicrobiales bacterium]